MGTGYADLGILGCGGTRVDREARRHFEQILHTENKQKLTLMEEKSFADFVEMVLDFEK